MMGRLLVRVCEFDHIAIFARAALEKAIPAGRLSRVKPAGTTMEGTKTRKVLICGAPFLVDEKVIKLHL